MIQNQFKTYKEEISNEKTNSGQQNHHAEINKAL